MRAWRRRCAWGLWLVVASGGCSSCRRTSTPVDAAVAALTAPRSDGSPASVGTLDLVDLLREGTIDAAGPVVDLGERQAAAFVVSPASLPTETVNGDSWVSVGTRLRLRVPLDETGEGAPSSVRLRIRRATARGVALLVDGVLVRAMPIPPRDDGGASVLTLPVAPDRFARPVVDVEIRFGTPRPVPGVLSPIAAQLDWVHLARADDEPARVNHLVADVAVERTPRRSLAFYAPTRLSTVMILPPAATLTAALAAEGPRGGTEALELITAVLRVEADNEEVRERRVEVTPNRPWRDVSLDLTSLANRPVRLSIAAEGDHASRLAVAAPTLRYRAQSSARAAPDAPPRPSVKHVVMVVVRGLRADRFTPALSPRLAGGGFARMMGGTVALAQAPAPKEFSALVSATSGVPADMHHVSELTDALDEEAPTLASLLAAAGVDTEAYTDDIAWIGSGADRGFQARHPCAGDVPTCRPDTMFAAAAETLTRRRDASTFTMIVTRAGLLPLDPTPEDISLLDPRPYEGTMTPSRTALYTTRGRPEAVGLSASDQERLSLLYDASLLAVDRGLATLLDRIGDQRLEADTLVIVVGDRGSALGENRTVADGPMTMGTIAETVLLARGAGATALHVDGVVGTVDAAATVLERFGVARPTEFDGVSVLGGVPHDRVLPFVATARWELGLRFGELVAMPHAPRDGGALGLYARADDPLSLNDLAATRPIARRFAEAALAACRPGAGRRLLPPSTRVLPAPLDAILRYRR